MRQPTHYWKGGIRGYSDIPAGPVHVFIETHKSGQQREIMNGNGEAKVVDTDGVIYWLPEKGLKQLKPGHITRNLL